MDSVHFIAVALVYAGLAGSLVGLVCLVWPFGALALTSRRRGAALFLGSAALVIGGWSLPAHERHVGAPRTILDTFGPRYQFSERHARRICAPPERIYEAIKRVPAEEIALFHTLAWIRRFGQRGPESILAPPTGTPILEAATRGGFLMLADDPSKEVVVGAIVVAPRAPRSGQRPTAEDFRRLAAPGFASAVMNFRIDEGRAGCPIVTTETRVFATDRRTRRSFARYWRVIYPGSAIIRRSWLRAIERRAMEGPKVPAG